MRSKEEVEQIESDAKYWQEFCEAVSPKWKVLGFTDRSSAMIHTAEYNIPNSVLNISASQRDDLMRAMGKSVIHEGEVTNGSFC